MSKYIKLEDAISKIVNTPTRVITDGLDDLTALADRQHEIIDMLSDLPTIEVSEDCISREYLKSFEYINKGDFNSIETIREWIDNAPSVVPSRAEGEWELSSDDDGEYGICSLCGNDADFTHYGKPYHYCPNCGMKMKGDKE